MSSNAPLTSPSRFRTSPTHYSPTSSSSPGSSRPARAQTPPLLVSSPPAASSNGHVRRNLSLSMPTATTNATRLVIPALGDESGAWLERLGRFKVVGETDLRGFKLFAVADWFILP